MIDQNENKMIFLLYNEIYNQFLIKKKNKNMKKFEKNSKFISVEKSTLDKNDYSGIFFDYDSCSFCHNKGELRAHVALEPNKNNENVEVSFFLFLI
jgi:hypothetical protein